MSTSRSSRTFNDSIRNNFLVQLNLSFVIAIIFPASSKYAFGEAVKDISSPALDSSRTCLIFIRALK